MSQQRNCDFYEVKPKKWYYTLERVGASEGDSEDCFGPFDDFEQAEQHLNHNHSNPGGYTVQNYDPSFVPTEYLQELLDKATTKSMLWSNSGAY